MEDPTCHDKITLKETSECIMALLKERSPRSIQGVPEELHPLPPFVSKQDWSELGDALRLKEQPSMIQVPGECWISLRCDGTGFSKLTKRLQRDGVLSKGYSKEFANIMMACCQELMTKFSTARCGYTQSDELTVLIPPMPVIRGIQEPHVYNGRLQKLCSLAAATVTSRFQYELMRLCQQNGLDPAVVFQSCMLPTFDCRVGTYETADEALSLILWRAYDCGINAVSDAVYKSGVNGARQVVKLTTEQKLPWLQQHNMLPLAAHQREGTFLVKRKRVEQGVNRKTGETVTYLRGRIEQVEGNVLQLYKDGALFPPEDVLSPQDGNWIQGYLCLARIV